MPSAKRKSYWQTMSTHSDRDKEAILAWFAPLCDGMTVESCEVLCDIATDREKKVKAVVVDAEGKRLVAVRTRGKNFSISISPIASNAA